MLKMAIFSVLMKLGVFRIPGIRPMMYWAYFGLKRRYRDIYHDLIERHPELFEGGHILDAGANIGCTSYFFSRIVSGGFRVYAFEPAPDNFRLLQNCVTAYHNSDRITAVNAAVGDHDGTIHLEINKLNHTAHRVVTAEHATGVIEVPLVSLDSYCHAHNVLPVKFVKIDVEGYELFVCRGMTQLIAANPGVVLGLEFGSSSQMRVHDEHQVVEFLSSQSLHLYTANSGEIRDCSIEDLKRFIEQRETVDILASKQSLTQ